MFDPVLNFQEAADGRQIHLFVAFLIARYVAVRNDTSLQYILSFFQD